MKFEIFKSENTAKFYFRLKAGNGEIVLSSQAYARKDSCKNGIKSVMTNAKEGTYEEKEAANGKFHFNLLAKNKKVIGSSQMYASKASMKNGIESVRKTDDSATVVDLTQA